MGLIERLVALVIMAGLLIGGLAVAILAAGLFDLALSDLPIATWAGEASDYLEAVASGGLTGVGVAILVGLILLGLILMVAAFWPQRSPHLAIGEDAFLSKSVLRDEVQATALGTRGVLDASVRFRGAEKNPRLVVDAATRPGNDEAELRQRLHERVDRRVQETGVPIGNLEVRVRAEDTQRRRARVR